MKYATDAQPYTPKKATVTSNNAKQQAISVLQLQEIQMFFF
jgi:hypothetical protein